MKVVATLNENVSVIWKKNKEKRKTNTSDLDKLKIPLKTSQYRTRITEELQNINILLEHLVIKLNAQILKILLTLP